MDKRLQIDVMENVRDNGKWTWGWQTEILYNEKALARFEDSGFKKEEYLTCTVMLVESGKMVAHRDDNIGSTHSPLCLTIAGLEYLAELKQPQRQWFKRNWFPVTVAVATILLAVAGIVVDVADRIIR